MQKYLLDDMLLFHPIKEKEALGSNKKYVSKLLGIDIKWNTEQEMAARSDFWAEYFALSLTMHSYICLIL